MLKSILITSRCFFKPITAARIWKTVLPVGAGSLVLLALGRYYGFIPASAFPPVREFLFLPGLPFFALLMSEMALRDGIGNRTILYPLLGPVSRSVQAVVRTVLTALLLAVLALILLGGVNLIGQLGWGDIPRHLLAISLGALTYTAGFGLVHLVSNRSLIVGMAIFLFFDLPIGRLPFGIRNLSPSYHLGVIAGNTETYALPISLDSGASSPLTSSLVLVALTLVAITLTAVLFSRKKLVNLC
jgi:hypothetical protein